MEDDNTCIEHFFCNCFQLVESERKWEFSLIMTAIVIVTIGWFFALMMVPPSAQRREAPNTGTLAVWMAWLLGFVLLVLLSLLIVRGSIEHKIKYKRFRDPTRDPFSKLLG